MSQGDNPENAPEFLQKLLDKHGLTMDDINDEDKIVPFFFKYNRAIKMRLIAQIAYAVIPDRDTYIHRPGKEVLGECTAAEKALMTEMIGFYWALLKKEIDRIQNVAYSAFLHKHKIFPVKERPLESDSDPRPIDEQILMANLMEGMSDESFHRQIELT